MMRRLAHLGLWIGLITLLLALPLYTPIGKGWVADLMVEDQAPVPSDLIIVLGGDFLGPRVLKGVQLLRAGMAQRLVISGPIYFSNQIPATPEGALAIANLAEQKIDTTGIESFLISGGSTLDEVDELGTLLLKYKAKSVLLVTSDYHSRRACLAFRLSWPTTRCTCVPSLEPDTQRWVRREWPRLLGTMLFRGLFLPYRWVLALIQMP